MNGLKLKAFSAAVFMFFTVVSSAAPDILRKPNVIFILADDLGYGDVGYSRQNSQNGILTPHIDRLAHGGVILSSHYAAAPVCAPSRASLLTGRVQGSCSLKDNCFDMPIREEYTLGSVFKRAGYVTWAIGKWGVGGGGESGTERTAHPLDKGFDYYYGFLDHMAGHTYYHYNGYVRKAFMGITENRSDATDTAVGRYSTDLFIAKTKQLIEQHMINNPSKPFFIYLAVNAIHGSGICDDSLKCKKTLHVPGGAYPAHGVSWPLAKEPSELRNTWIDPRYKNLPDNHARYATAVSRLDDGIGDLVALLKKYGIDHDTMIVFTSDNGPADEYGADPRFFRSNGPFDGFKRDVFEGGLRVPAFVNWPAGIASGQKDQLPSQFHDWMATLADIVGLGSDDFWKGEGSGVSLMRRWKDANGNYSGKCDKSFIYSSYFFPWGGSTGAFKDFKNRKGDVRGYQQMTRVGDYVALRAKNSHIRLYNVVEDPFQNTDLSSDESQKSRLEQMKLLLDSRIKQVH